jgi:hypothetical protein
MAKMTVADVATALRDADVSTLTPATAPDWLKMIDFLRQQTLAAIDEVALRADALDAREKAVAEAEAVLATRKAAVERIMSLPGAHPATPPSTKRSMWSLR